MIKDNLLITDIWIKYKHAKIVYRNESDKKQVE